MRKAVGWLLCKLGFHDPSIEEVVVGRDGTLPRLQIKACWREGCSLKVGTANPQQKSEPSTLLQQNSVDRSGYSFGEEMAGQVKLLLKLGLGNLDGARTVTRKIFHPYWCGIAWADIYEASRNQEDLAIAREAIREISGPFLLSKACINLFRVSRDSEDLSAARKAVQELPSISSCQEGTKILDALEKALANT
ncbi:MAG: hypothetical protein Q7S62_03445 [bacterium]|nr:hypothetical protein [bacterium]